VFGTAGRKECPLFVKHWDRAAGREQHRIPEERKQIAEGAARAYIEALEMGAEKVVLVKYKMDKPSYDIESPTRDAIRRLGADDSNLAVITWGNETTGTKVQRHQAHDLRRPTSGPVEGVHRSSTRSRRHEGQ